MLFGIGMTVLARVGPWLWPGWPAVTLLDFVLGTAAPSVVTPFEKAMGVIALLFVNVTFWALLAWVALWALDRLRRR